MNYVPNDIENKSIADYFKAIINDGFNNSHENIKSIAILITFQIVVPATIKFVCWLISTIEDYVGCNDKEEDVINLNSNNQLNTNQQEIQVTELVAQENIAVNTNNEII